MKKLLLILFACSLLACDSDDNKESLIEKISDTWVTNDKMIEITIKEYGGYSFDFTFSKQYDNDTCSLNYHYIFAGSESLEGIVYVGGSDPTFTSTNDWLLKEQFINDFFDFEIYKHYTGARFYVDYNNDILTLTDFAIIDIRNSEDIYSFGDITLQRK